jgi:hypothetical protein
LVKARIVGLVETRKVLRSQLWQARRHAYEAMLFFCL